MVLEISVNGGAFVDAVTAGGSFSLNGYNSTISSAFGSAIGGRPAWTGLQAAFIQTVYDLPASVTAGSTIQFRWRMATDTSVASGVVQIDSLTANNLGVGTDVSLTLTDAPDPVTAGTNITYTATATNNGPAGADGIVITLPLPAGTTFVSATPSAGGSCNAASPVVCTFAGTTAVGASATATIVAGVPAATAAGTVLTATATSTSVTTDTNPANNTATTTTTVATSADLAVTLTASVAQTPVNVPVTFNATSTNLGPSDAQNVQLSIALSPDFRYSSHSASAGATCTTPQVGVSGTVTCTWAGPTAVGAVRTLSVVAFSNNETINTVTASTSSATTDPVVASNTASVSVQVGLLVEEIPTLGRNALLLMGLLLALAGFVAIRRNV
jgi:uncharacterized repeat protein (TIGR01451 family)